MFNWIVSYTKQYLEPLKFVYLCWIELFEIELFDYLTANKRVWCLIELLVMHNIT